LKDLHQEISLDVRKYSVKMLHSTYFQQYFWVRASWCTAWLSSTFWWRLTHKIARATSALAFQRAVAAAVCFCSQQRSISLKRRGTCLL